MGSTIRFVFCASLAAAWSVCAGAASAGGDQVKETVLYSFLGGSDGGGPYAGVITDQTGALYGTTVYGGISNSACFGPCGVVFKLTPPPARQPPWSETTLWSFSGGNDGASPFGGLFARDQSPSPKKTLYGTTAFNGPSFPAGCSGFGCGTVFKLTDGSLTTLWGFTGGSDGANPNAALVAEEETGALYGTTSAGGTSGNGTVFKIDTIAQTLTTIYAFSGSPDGATPGALLADEEGVLYGTTFGGGNNGCYLGGGCGTVFKLTPPGRGQTAWTESILWSFTGGGEGGNPQAGLIADERGALYGTTFSGGASGAGTVFKLSPPGHGQTSWTLSTLHAFAGGSDGGLPSSPLLADGSGALYGTTVYGGAFSTSSCPFPAGCGVVFKLTPPASGQTPWTETVLWTFSGGSDGASSYYGLIADDRGALYGTTAFGGNVTGPACVFYGCGVVFKLTGTGFATEDEQ